LKLRSDFIIVVEVSRLFILSTIPKYAHVAIDAAAIKLIILRSGKATSVLSLIFAIHHSCGPAASPILTLREALAIFFVSQPSSHGAIRYPRAV
jgi:hypothetical protein